MRRYDRESVQTYSVDVIYPLTSNKNEPLHDKTNKATVRPAKTRINLGIRPDWSVLAVRMKKAWVLSYPLSAKRRL